MCFGRCRLAVARGDRLRWCSAEHRGSLRFSAASLSSAVVCAFGLVHSQQSKAWNIKTICFHSLFVRKTTGQIATVSYAVSVRPSLHMEQKDTCRTDFHEITYWGFLLLFAGTFEFWLRTNEKQTLHIKATVRL